MEGLDARVRHITGQDQREMTHMLEPLRPKGQASDRSAVGR